MPDTWKFSTIVLPIPPVIADQRVLRKQTVDALIDQFPFAIDSGPDSFELQLKGLIWPKAAKEALWEDIKNAEEPSIQIEVADDDVDFKQYEGRYAVNKSSIKINGPNFTKDAGLDVPVWTYDITFIQFADQSTLADNDTGSLDGDESGIGFGSIEDLLGNFDFDKFIFTLETLFTV